MEMIRKPLIGIANSVNTIIPGHMHLDKIVDAVRAGIHMAGGTPIEFGGIGVCDGIAMNHPGMKYSLASRELIADSIEVMAIAHAFDALVMVPNCDKIVPGMLMAVARLDLSPLVVSGGRCWPVATLMARKIARHRARARALALKFLAILQSHKSWFRQWRSKVREMKGQKEIDVQIAKISPSGSIFALPF